MDAVLDSPVNVQRSPSLTFSPHSTPFTLVSSTISQTDTAIPPPPAEHLLSSDSTSAVTVRESPIMPEATTASTVSTPPPSSAPAAELNNTGLSVTQNELAQVREELNRVRAQLRQIQEEAAEIRARQAQIAEGSIGSSEAINTQGGTNLESQFVSTEVQRTSSTLQETPSTNSSTSQEQPVRIEVVAPLAGEIDQDAPTSQEEPSLRPTAPGPAAEADDDALTFQEEPAPRAINPRLAAEGDEEALESNFAQAAVEETRTEELLLPDRPWPPDVSIQPPVPVAPVDFTAEPPEWVDIEEDTSAPEEDELKEIEASNDISARDVKHHEESFYAEPPEDPEQQPVQKMRLTWVIKGVRGTKEKPNRARIMNSPAVLVGGFYWYLKFFPRGNNSSALSAYVKCSRKAPKPDEEVPENTFSVVYGAPDADLGELKPAVDMSIPATAVTSKDDSRAAEGNSSADEASKKAPERDALQHDESANASADTEEASAAAEDQEEDSEDWRVPAQIGIIIYNPEEPRTKFDMAACHQFNKYNDDWGWTNFHGPWSEIHKRRTGERQALLRNDTLALDAYIRIFNDPSQSLWWHECGGEKRWDSVALTGYPAMGTKLYHTPGVAGITSWLLLAPFRRIFQSLETDAYRRNSHIRPRSLCSQVQMILYLMRKQKRDERFVSLEAILEIMDKLDESGTDVVTFWEGFRRSLELELQGDPSAIAQIADIFDTRQHSEAEALSTSPLTIPVAGVSSVQDGIEQALGEQNSKTSAKQSFPKFLTIKLDRQKFDETVREWKLLYDRVRLSEELDLSQWSAEAEVSKYTLYGFVVHAEERNSGKFYSVLRPAGPGTKWLAFDDGTTKQVISYTKHRIQEFEGLEGDVLKDNKAPRQTAYVAMYIRTDLLNEFLPGPLEPYELSPWLKNCPQVRDYLESKDVPRYEEETRSEVKLEIYSSERAKERHGLVDIQDLKDVQAADCRQPAKHLTVRAATTYQELRQKLARWNDVDNPEKIKLWTMQPPSPGAPLNSSFRRVTRLSKQVWDRDSATRSICIWMHVLKTDDEVKLFGDPEPPVDSDSFDRTTIEDDPEEGPEDGPGSATEPTAEEDALRDGTVEVNAATEPTEPTQPSQPTEPNSSPTDRTTSGEVEPSTSNEELSTNNRIPVAMAGQDLSSLTANTEDSTAGSDTVETSANIEAALPEVIGATTATPDETPVLVEAVAGQDSENQALALLASSPVPANEGHGQPIAAPAAEAPSYAAVSAEDEFLIAALIAEDLEILDEASRDNSQADADTPIMASNTAATPAAMTADASATGAVNEPSDVPATEVPTDVPAPEERAVDNSEESSPAAAADTSNDDAQSDSSEDEANVQHTPAQFYYGFIQLFDAQAQEFVMNGDFMARAKENVREFVRKHLGYAQDRNILVWRRGNAYRLTSIQASSTFEDMKDDSGDREDGCVLVVGDVLSEST
jgi:Ubiquitin carboxyl-terminal hydrolase